MSPAPTAPDTLDPGRLGFTPQATPHGLAWWRTATIPAATWPPMPETAWAAALGFAHRGPWVVLDLESTGRRLAARTYAFLVGVLEVHPQRPWQWRQWLLPHPADEAALWHHVAATWPADAVLVTYNGARFDLPLMHMRAQMVGLWAPPWAGAQHVDVLSWVRRAFREAWPNYRLGTAAQRLVGLERPADDVPAASLPERYHHALLTRDVTPLAPAVSHHQADVLALAQVWLALARDLAQPPRARHYPAATWLSRGRLYRQYRDLPRARQALKRAFRRATTPELRARAGLALAAVQRQMGDRAAACAVWEALAAEGVWEAYEHRIRAARRWDNDLEQARGWLRRAQVHLAAASTSPLDRALWQPKFQALAERLGLTTEDVATRPPDARSPSGPARNAADAPPEAR